MSEVLGREQLTELDNFFDCGGYSLKALQLIVKLSAVLECHIAISALFQNPTAGQLAQHISGLLNKGIQPQTTSLVPINNRGSRTPIFFTPGGNGSEEEFLAYAQLSRYLGADQPFYGLRCRASMTGVTPHASVEAMARDYLKEVRDVQKCGPYNLVGECSGGVIAFEMARQLRQAGEEVSHLILLDARAPDLRHELSQRVSWFHSTVKTIFEKKSAEAVEDSLLQHLYDEPGQDRPRDRRWINYKRAALALSPAII